MPDLTVCATVVGAVMVDAAGCNNNSHEICALSAEPACMLSFVLNLSGVVCMHIDFWTVLCYIACFGHVLYTYCRSKVQCSLLSVVA